jgi:hypothetical protein
MNGWDQDVILLPRKHKGRIFRSCKSSKDPLAGYQLMIGMLNKILSRSKEHCLILLEQHCWVSWVNGYNNGGACSGSEPV